MIPAYRRFGPSGWAVSMPVDEGVVFGDVAALGDVEADAFISLCRIGRAQRRGPEHHEVWLVDRESLVANADLAAVLADTADAIAQLRSEGRRVFVHCVMCQSRTPAVAAAWLIRQHRLDADDADAMVRSVVPDAAPNRGLR
jgi:hypothetical protein